MENNRILSEIIVQLIGFAVVFWVLRHFAWSKLLGAIDNRRRTIEDSFADIEKKKSAIDALEKEYRLKLDRIEQEARAKIQEAAAQGQSLSKDIQDKARQDAERIVERAKTEINQDLLKVRQALRSEVVEISTLISEKILKEKLDARGHEKLVEQFLKDLEKVQA